MFSGRNYIMKLNKDLTVISKMSADNNRLDLPVKAYENLHEIKIDDESWFRMLMSFSWGEKRIYAVFARLGLGVKEIACIEKDYEIYMRESFDSPKLK